MTRILHLADVHLDRPFRGAGRAEGRAGRERLRRTFRRCVALARDRGADLITVGGDLWEDEHVTPDTRAFAADELGRAGCPVALVCGNHDPNLPGGAYARTAWPANVRVLGSTTPTELRVGELSVWGVSWTGRPLDLSFLEHFRVPDDARRHVLLVHGTVAGIGPAEGAHGRFDPSAVERAGFSLCLAGHLHAAGERLGVVYPGSPEPLGWGERGRHCAAVVDVGTGAGPWAEVEVELIDTGEHRYVERVVDCTGAASSAEIAGRLELALAPELTGGPAGLHLRVVLEGEAVPEAEIAEAQLAAGLGGRPAEVVVVDRTRAAYDLDALGAEPTARGGLVRALAGQVEAAEDPRSRERLEHALVLGLRALDGRRDLGIT